MTNNHDPAEMRKQDKVKEESQIKFISVNEVKEEISIKKEVDADCGEGEIAKTLSSTFIVNAQPCTSKEMTDMRVEHENTIHTKMKLTPRRRLLPPPPKFDELTNGSSLKEIESHFNQNQYDSFTLQPPVAGEAPANLLQSHTECNDTSTSSGANSSNTDLQFSSDASPCTAIGGAFMSALETPVKIIKRKKLSTRERYFRNIQEKEEREHIERMRHLRWKREMLQEKRETLKEKQEALRKEREAVREWAAVAKVTEQAIHRALAVSEEPNQTTNNVPSIVEETKQALQKLSETVVIAAKAFKAVHALFMIESNCDIVI